MTGSQIVVTPLPPQPGSKANFGASITGVDLNNLSEVDFQAIREAIYVHKVVLIKEQQNLLPKKQVEFLQRLDPDSPPIHGFGSSKEVKATSGVLTSRRYFTVPEAEQIQLVGWGYQGEDHYGLKGVTIDPLNHADFQRNPLTEEEMESGQSRFNHFHFDGIVYGPYPSRVTTLRCIRSPKGPDVTVRWDDGTGRTTKAKPGLTAFFSCTQLYDLLSDEEKEMFDNSYWEPAPYPFVWTGTRVTRSVGLGLEPGGEVVPLDQLPEWSPDKVHKFPMVWLNPVTGEKGVQINPYVVRKLYLKPSKDGKERVVEDLEEIRVMLNEIYDRILTPEYIAFPPYEEGDIAMWNNWGVLHSAVEYPRKYGVRTMHQAHLASSTMPVGPV